MKHVKSLSGFVAQSNIPLEGNIHSTNYKKMVKLANFYEFKN